MSSTKTIDNRSGYDRWSLTYDTDLNSTVAADDVHFPKLWSHVRGKRVLEIGCGTGRHTVRLAAQGNEVVGIDLSAGMLRQALQKLGSSSVTLIEGDFLQHDLAGASFDVIVCSLVIEHITDLNSFFKKAAYVSRNDAELFLSEIHPKRIKGGTQANFKDSKTGEAYLLQSYAHSATAIEDAARAAGFLLESSREIIGDESFAKAHPDWQKHIGKPLIQVWHFKT